MNGYNRRWLDLVGSVRGRRCESASFLYEGSRVGKDENDYMLNVCVDFINENVYNIFIRRIVI